MIGRTPGRWKDRPSRPWVGRTGQEEPGKTPMSAASSSPRAPHPPCYLLYLGLPCLRRQLLSRRAKAAEDGAWAHEIATMSGCLPVAAQLSSLRLYVGQKRAPGSEWGPCWRWVEKGQHYRVRAAAGRDGAAAELSALPALPRHLPVLPTLERQARRQTPASEPSGPGRSPSPASHSLHNPGRSPACLHLSFPHDRSGDHDVASPKDSREN